MRSHLISQFLIRRFNNPYGRVFVHNKISGMTDIKSSKEISYIETDESIYGKYEHDWGNIERKLAGALFLLDKGTLLTSQEAKDNLKMFMALLFVRSSALVTNLQRSEQKYFNDVIKQTKAAYPEYSSQVNNSIATIRRNWVNDLKNKVLPEIIETNFTKVLSHISSFDLMIATPEKGARFILGDVPILNMDENGKLGMLSGVGVTNSKSFCLPLGPKHAVALITHNPSSDYILLSNSQVRNLNNRTKIYFNNRILLSNNIVYFFLKRLN